MSALCFGFLLRYVALSRGVAFFLIVTIDEVGIILPALSFYYKFIRFPRLLTAFWTCGYHFRETYTSGGFKCMVSPMTEPSNFFWRMVMNYMIDN